MIRGERKARWIVAGILLIVLALVGWSLYQRTTIAQTRIHLGDAVFRAEVVDTDQARQKGLSGRQALPENEVMLFAYEQPDFHGIWMKDMHIDLDIVWLDEEQRVVHIVKNASPDTYPKIFRPEKPAKYIIEMNAGLVERKSITTGQRADFEIIEGQTVY